MSRIIKCNPEPVHLHVDRMILCGSVKLSTALKILVFEEF